MIDNSKIQEIVNKIALNFNPDKIILFGSYATGNPDQNSDLDLLIIRDKKIVDRQYDTYGHYNLHIKRI